MKFALIIGTFIHYYIKMAGENGLVELLFNPPILLFPVYALALLIIFMGL